MVMGRRVSLLPPCRGCRDRSLKAIKLSLDEQDEGLFLNVVGVIGTREMVKAYGPDTGSSSGFSIY